MNSICAKVSPVIEIESLETVKGKNITCDADNKDDCKDLVEVKKKNRFNFHLCLQKALDKAGAVIAEQLEEMIFNGTYADGDRLDEVRLAHGLYLLQTQAKKTETSMSLSELLLLIWKETSLDK